MGVKFHYVSNSMTVLSLAANPAILRADAVQAGLITQDTVNPGVKAYTVTTNTGDQIWVFVRNSIITDAGVNQKGLTR
jgi:hypothetical protein